MSAAGSASIATSRSACIPSLDGIRACAVSADWEPFRLLNLGWVRFIGVLELDLPHAPAMLRGVWTWTRPPRTVKAVIGLIMTIGIGHLIDLQVERPAARLRTRPSRILVSEHAPATTGKPAVAMASQARS